MDPVSLALGVSGLALKLGGTFGLFGSQSKEAELQQQQIQLEMQAEAERKKQMELIAHRQQMELLRNSQKARAMALNNATNQGASQAGSSGLQGGYGQISGDTQTSLLGINQNLEIGRNLFGINNQISGVRMQMADAQSEAATYKGLSSLGGDLISSMGYANQLFGGGNPHNDRNNGFGNFWMGSGPNWYNG